MGVWFRRSLWRYEVGFIATGPALKIRRLGEGVTMNTAQQEIESGETVGLKTCNNCSREICEGDRFCRRCGADQNGRSASASPDAMEAELKYRTSCLPEADDCRRFSGSLVKSLVEGACVRTAPINNRFAKLVVSMLAAAALWLMIVLLAPFEAYVAARSIANED